MDRCTKRVIERVTRKATSGPRTSIRGPLVFHVQLGREEVDRTSVQCLAIGILAMNSPNRRTADLALPLPMIGAVRRSSGEAQLLPPLESALLHTVDRSGEPLWFLRGRPVLTDVCGGKGERLGQAFPGLQLRPFGSHCDTTPAPPRR